jgi:hypothetical protein
MLYNSLPSLNNTFSSHILLQSQSPSRETKGTQQLGGAQAKEKSKEARRLSLFHGSQELFDLSKNNKRLREYRSAPYIPFSKKKKCFHLEKVIGP